MATLEVGDLLPPRTLTDNEGALVDLQHSDRAGRGLLLVSALPDAAEGVARLVAEQAGRLAGSSIGQGLLRACVVSRQRIAGWAGCMPLLVDGGGLLEPGMLLLAGFDGRILVRAGLASLDEALTLWQRRVEAAPPAVIAAQAPVLLLEDVLEAPLRAALLAYWERQPKTANAVASRLQGNGATSQSHKRRADVVLEDQGLYRQVMLRLAQRVLPTIGRVFNMEITRAEALRVGCYDASDRGTFARHRDNTTPYTAHRRFACSLNLNEDYEGGELTFPEFGRMCYRPPAGGGAIFSCSLLHEALPVTAGRRFGLFTFLNDRAAAEAEDRMRRQMGPQSI